MRDISLHLMDILQNSVRAGARNITVLIGADKEKDMLEITIRDDGSGMDSELLRSVTDPFTTTRTSRKIGLGIPLLKDSAERASGKIDIQSEKGKGTTVKADFRISHIDRLPIGDISQTMADTILAYPETTFELELTNTTTAFRFSTTEVKQSLGTVPITHYDVIAWIKDYIDEGIKAIFGGVLHEVVS